MKTSLHQSTARVRDRLVIQQPRHPNWCVRELYVQITEDFSYVNLKTPVPLGPLPGFYYIQGRVSPAWPTIAICPALAACFPPGEGSAGNSVWQKHCHWTLGCGYGRQPAPEGRSGCPALRPDWSHSLNSYDMLHERQLMYLPLVKYLSNYFQS